MQLTKLEDLGTAFVWVVKAVICRGQTLVVSHHQILSKVVIALASGVERRMRQPVIGRRKCLKTVRRRVLEIVLEGRSKNLAQVS